MKSECFRQESYPYHPKSKSPVRMISKLVLLLSFLSRGALLDLWQPARNLLISIKLSQGLLDPFVSAQAPKFLAATFLGIKAITRH